MNLQPAILQRNALEHRVAVQRTLFTLPTVMDTELASHRTAVNARMVGWLPIVLFATVAITLVVILALPTVTVSVAARLRVACLAITTDPLTLPLATQPLGSTVFAVILSFGKIEILTLLHQSAL